MNKTFRKTTRARERVVVPTEAEGQFGRVSDVRMAEILGCSPKTARLKRRQRRIPPLRGKHNWSRIVEEIRANIPVPIVAQRFSIPQREVYNYLAKNKISFTRLRGAPIPPPTDEQLRILKTMAGVGTQRKAEVLGVDEKWIRKWQQLCGSSAE